MSSTLTSPSISAAIAANLASGSAPAKATCNVSHQCTPALTVGSATNNVNAVYAASLTLASSSNNDIDLTTLTDPLGNAIAGAVLVGYIVQNNGTAGQLLTIGGGTNPIIAAAETDEPVQALGGFRCEFFPDGGKTIDSTHKTFRIAASGGGTVSYAVTLLLKQ